MARRIKVSLEMRLRMRQERLLRAVERAKAGSLSSVGYLVSTIAKGEPPPQI